jgi:RNA polymerase sigma factor (sigma-70 family)
MRNLESLPGGLSSSRLVAGRARAVLVRGRWLEQAVRLSHTWSRRCCRGMDLVGNGGAVAASGVSAARPVVAVDDRAGRRERVTVSRPIRGAVRADLDVAQEVFLSFGRTSVPADEARAWLSVAAAHTALNLLRSGRRRASREERTAAAGDVVVADAAEAAVTSDERRRVRAALARLPRRQAVALVLRHSGLSYVEIASALDLSPTSVGTTVRRAESALREELNRHASSS